MSLLSYTTIWKLPKDGRCSVVVESVAPEIGCGRFAIERVIGETVFRKMRGPIRTEKDFDYFH